MSSSEAQRSPIHEATEDSNREPNGPVGRPAPRTAEGRAAQEGTGEASANPKQRPDTETKVSPDRHESSFGGPVDIDDPDAV